MYEIIGGMTSEIDIRNPRRHNFFLVCYIFISNFQFTF